jgi:hypothetical protein
MKRFGGRRVSGRARLRGHSVRRIERLESRSVLSGSALTNLLPFAPKGMFHDDSHLGGFGAYVDAPSNMKLDSFGGISPMSDKASLGSAGFSAGGYGFYDPSLSGMSYGGYGSISEISFGQEFSAPSEIIVIFTPPSDNGIVISSPAVMPQESSVVSPHAEVAPISTTKPSVSPSFDAPPHPAAMVGPSQASLVVTPRISADVNTLVESHATQSMASSAAAGSMRLALSTTMVSFVHSIPLLEGAASAWTQTLTADHWLQTGSGSVGEVAQSAIASAANSAHQAIQLAGGAASYLQTHAMANLPVDKASLAGMPLDIANIDQALRTVMSEMKSLGVEVTHWLDNMHLTPIVTTAVVAAFGGGAIYYWRRCNTEETNQPGEEASSSWLFARLQSHSG